MSSVPVEKLAIGVTGFEPATARSQSGCATKLRYTPLHRYLVRCMIIIPSAGAIVKPHPIMNNPMGLVNIDSTI